MASPCIEKEGIIRGWGVVLKPACLWMLAMLDSVHSDTVHQPVFLISQGDNPAAWDDVGSILDFSEMSTNPAYSLIFRQNCCEQHSEGTVLKV